MGIFSEFVPSQKSAILTFIELQKTLAEVADELDREAQSPSYTRTLSLQSIYEIPRKKSWIETIAQLQKETEEEMKKFHETNEKIDRLHDMLETIDEINYFADIPKEKKDEVEKKNLQSCLAVRRVVQLESGDSFEEIPKIYKKMSKKSVDGSKKFKSKFTVSPKNHQWKIEVPQKSFTKKAPESSAKKSSEASPKSLASQTSMKPSKNIENPSSKKVTPTLGTTRPQTKNFISLDSKALTNSLPSKVRCTSPPRNLKVTQSIRKVLDEAKMKREKKNLQKKAPDNVINLRFN